MKVNFSSDRPKVTQLLVEHRPQLGHLWAQRALPGSCCNGSSSLRQTYFTNLHSGPSHYKPRSDETTHIGGGAQKTQGDKMSHRMQGTVLKVLFIQFLELPEVIGITSITQFHSLSICEVSVCSRPVLILNQLRG